MIDESPIANGLRDGFGDGRAILSKSLPNIEGIHPGDLAGKVDGAFERGSAAVGRTVGSGGMNMVQGARNGMKKFAVGAALFAGGAYLFSMLRQSARNQAENDRTQRAIDAIKGPELPSVLPAANAMPQPQLMQPAPSEPALDAKFAAAASQPFEMPPAPSVAAVEGEDTKFRDMITAQRGGEPGKAQPFVAPTSSLAEAVMTSKDAAAVAPTLAG